MAPMEPQNGSNAGKDVVYKQVLTDPGMFLSSMAERGAMQSFHRRGMKQDAQDRRHGDIGQMTTPPLDRSPAMQAHWEELMAGKTLACPCCDGLDGRKIGPPADDAQRLAAARAISRAMLRMALASLRG
jgi:hypothetical protein